MWGQGSRRELGEGPGVGNLEVVQLRFPPVSLHLTPSSKVSRKGLTLGVM